MTYPAASDAVREQQVRADFLDWLYVKSGRANGLYTGLWEEFKQQGIEEWAEKLANDVRRHWATSKAVYH